MKKIILLSLLTVFISAPALAQNTMDTTPNTSIGVVDTPQPPTTENWDTTRHEIDGVLRTERQEIMGPNHYNDPIDPLNSGTPGTDARKYNTNY